MKSHRTKHLDIIHIKFFESEPYKGFMSFVRVWGFFLISKSPGMRHMRVTITYLDLIFQRKGKGKKKKKKIIVIFSFRRQSTKKEVVYQSKSKKGR